MQTQITNPIKLLILSRKFWLAVIDLVISIALYFSAKYFPMQADDVKFVILSLQPVFLLLIGALAYENVTTIKATGGGRG